MLKAIIGSSAHGSRFMTLLIQLFGCEVDVSYVLPEIPVPIGLYVKFNCQIDELTTDVCH